MANNYGFDFLRAEHNLPNQGGTALSTPPRPTAPPSDTNSYIGSNNNNKSNLEKQADILLFLRHHRSSGCLPPSIIRKSLGIDLTSDPVAELLQNNPKVSSFSSCITCDENVTRVSNFNSIIHIILLYRSSSKKYPIQRIQH